MKYLYSFLVLLLGFTLPISAQTSAVKGKVTDTEGNALEFATVVLYSAADSAIVKAGYSDDKGVFDIRPVPAGTYWLRATYVGFPVTNSEPFELAPGEDREVGPLVMAEGGTEIEEVKITTERPLVTVKPDMTVFNVEGTVNAVGENAFNLLRKAPGVVVDNNDNIMLLGKSGVRIYIDGKPSPLSAADLANLLKSMQSDQIESIEIITNPSSKFDAEGNAGIINVKMKRDKTMGANATVNLDYSTWIYNRYNGSISANYRNKRLNAFGSYSGGLGKMQNFMNFYREQATNSFTQSTIMVRDYVNHNFRAGADFYLGKEHTVGFLVNGLSSTGTHDSDTRTDIRDLATDTVQSYLLSLTENDFTRTNLNANLNYRFANQKGTTLGIDLDYGQFENNTISFQPNEYRDPETDTLIVDRSFASEAPTTIDMYTFKADYEHGFLKGKLGIGTKLALVTTDNTFDFFNMVDGEEVLDTNRSNQFVYDENVNAAYLNYNRQINKWGIQLGLRVEQTNSLGVLTAYVPTANDRVERHYLSFFPSGGITYNMNKVNTFRLTYSRRIDRPRYDDLNPFVQKLDELSYRQGNHRLQPQFTHNMEVGHTYKYTLNTTASYAITSGFFTNVIDTVEGSRTVMTQLNLSTRKVATLSVSYPFSPVKWWSTFTNASVFNVTNDADFPGDEKDIHINRTSFSAFHQSTFNLPEQFGIQLSGFYSSPGIWSANFWTEDFWGVEVGATKKFFKERGLLKVGLSDIFHSMQWSGYLRYGDLYSAGSGGWESRQFKVSYTHTFGNTAVKAARRRATGLEEEQKRTNGGGDAPGR